MSEVEKFALEGMSSNLANKLNIYIAIQDF